MAENNKKINAPAEEKKAEAKATKSKEKKPNAVVLGFKKIIKFFKDTVGELKKVVWTSKTEVWKSFKLVIATVVAVSVGIAIVDAVALHAFKSIAELISLSL